MRVAGNNTNNNINVAVSVVEEKVIKSLIFTRRRKGI
jgi:hypothetical protein